ncbi:quinone oxidoreductase [Rummeliibacillus sp. TYF005]|uniref:quinone oxidoreductase family protein n=1 Tax=Rummeliibacillus sp. TYF005 TaxID=2058214 RepID=UPI000F523E02|nr:quinone oxidoreductase [Rummeliibacillus sp. TYF005]RPJ94393.1 quinone oxidoreductase [Rummeliibacillus sp. TYF005]
MKALVFNEFGDSTVLQYTEIPNPEIRPNEVLVRTKSIGLNFADIYRRKGNYHLAGEPPFILGYEGAGIIEAVGKNVSQVQVGDRVAFADVPFANAEQVAVPSEKLIVLPEEISFDVAASILLQGLTAHYLTNDSYKVKANDSVVIHAASGGVGQNLVQIAKLYNARVIALTSTMEKGKKALEVGADIAFTYDEDWTQSVMKFTDGKGADVVYDSVGSTLEDSFQATRIGGTVVFFGMSGGDPAPIDPRMLMDTSKTLTGGDLWNVLTSFEERQKRSKQLFDWIISGKLQLQSPTVFPLEEGAKAHDFLESRKSTGKILLKP